MARHLTMTGEYVQARITFDGPDAESMLAEAADVVRAWERSARRRAQPGTIPVAPKLPASWNRHFRLQKQVRK